MYLNRFINVVVIILVIGVSFSSCIKNSIEKNVEGELESTEENVDKAISLEDMEGKNLNLEDYHGKVVFLNFWATWCKPCIAEMPAIDRMIAELDKEEYVFLAASDENMDKIRKFVEKHPHQFKYVHLKTNVYKLGLSVLPTTFIIDKQGEIVEKIIGAREWDSPESIQQLRGI
jgi:peroxiredoxin